MPNEIGRKTNINSKLLNALKFKWINFKLGKIKYENLNDFLVVEWARLQETNFSQNELTDDEEEMIARDAMDILLDNLNVDEDEFEEYEQEVDWMKFDDIIGHYTCLYL